MASWCPDISEAMDELSLEIPRYLDCVDTIRKECGHNPQWSNAGEFVPEEEVYVPSWWTGSGTPVVRQRSWLPKEEDDGA